MSEEVRVRRIDDRSEAVAVNLATHDAKVVLPAVLLGVAVEPGDAAAGAVGLRAVDGPLALGKQACKDGGKEN